MNQKGFVNIAIIILVIVIFGAIGYFTLLKRQTLPIETDQSQPATPKDAYQSNADECNLISNSAFRSINKYEVGLGPNGPAMGYWSIQFQKGVTLSDYGEPTFQWSHSDFHESGSYACKNNVLQVKFLNRSITAYYDENQKSIAEKKIAELKAHDKNVATQVLPVKTFWPAENYHQNYCQKNP